MATNGITNKRATLSTGVIEEVTFGKSFKNISIAKMSTGGSLAYKINSAMTDIDDTTANVLTDNIPTTDHITDYPITSLFLVADTDCDVQWQIRVQ